MEVILRNGSRFASQVDYPKGSIQNPLTRNEMREKFRSLSSTVLGNRKQEEVERMVFEIQKVKDVSELLRLVV
jgi:2-methylcitrate dehydratase PrpD